MKKIQLYENWLLERDLEIDEGDKEEYEKFFKSKLQQYDVSSPDELDKDKKKEFFRDIKDEWKKTGKVTKD